MNFVVAVVVSLSFIFPSQLNDDSSTALNILDEIPLSLIALSAIISMMFLHFHSTYITRILYFKQFLPHSNLRTHLLFL